MNTYLAKIVFRIFSGDGQHTPQFDVQTRLIHAHTASEAFSKATEIGKTNEDCFMNIKCQPVKWQFINVSEIVCLADFNDGDEVFSYIKEPLIADNYIAYLNEKAAAILAGDTRKFAGLIFN